MIPRAMDSPDVVEAVMLIEEIFGADLPGIMQKTSAARVKLWTGSNVTFRIEGPTRRLLLVSKNSPNVTRALNSPGAWMERREKNRLTLLSAKCFVSKEVW